jgi:hypothetical protein
MRHGNKEVQALLLAALQINKQFSATTSVAALSASRISFQFVRDLQTILVSLDTMSDH